MQAIFINAILEFRYSEIRDLVTVKSFVCIFRENTIFAGRMAWHGPKPKLSLFISCRCHDCTKPLSVKSCIIKLFTETKKYEKVCR